MGRLVGLDVGTVRTGVAISDPLGTFARPLGTLSMRGDWQGQLRELVGGETVDLLVVGLPRHMNGDEGDSAHRARTVGEQAADLFPGAALTFIDERLTTVMATRAMVSGDMARKDRRSKVDSAAAVLILQNYLDGQRS